jgi:hypothetical protein
MLCDIIKKKLKDQQNQNKIKSQKNNKLFNDTIKPSKKITK